MKKTTIIALVVMSIITVFYIYALVYANSSNESPTDTAYSAILYKDQPTKWYLPADLGITHIEDYGAKNATWLHVVVPKKLDPGNLTIVKPIFKYNDKFYQIIESYITADYSEDLKCAAVPVIGGWLFVGILVIRERKIENRKEE